MHNVRAMLPRPVTSNRLKRVGSLSHSATFQCGPASSRKEVEMMVVRKALGVQLCMFDGCTPRAPERRSANPVLIVASMN